MKKQTAVEFLIESLPAEMVFGNRSLIELFSQAKEIEMGQIAQAYRNGRTDQDSTIEKWHKRSALQYINDTYNNTTTTP